MLEGSLETAAGQDPGSDAPKTLLELVLGDRLGASGHSAPG